MTVAGADNGARPVVHFEIEAQDPDRLAPFYEQLFHWKTHDGVVRFFEAGLGGAVTMPPFDVPGGPTLAGVSDPEGNPITLVQQ